MKKSSKLDSRDVKRFVKTDLVKKISRDLRTLKIVNEAEFEANAYLHLRRFLKKDKAWSIRVQKFITKTSYGNKTIRYFPDIVLERRKPRVIVELKEKINLRKKYIRSDARKLQQLITKKETKYGIILYLFRSKDEKSDKEWQKEVTSWLPPRYRPRITCVVINEYSHVPKKDQKKWLKQWKKKSKRKF